jgi:hypothetical protein
MLRFAPIAILGGGAVGFAIGGFRLRIQPVLHGALIGFMCYLMACIGELLLRRWLEAKPEAWWRRALIYFFGGQIGWPIGLFLGLPLIYGEPIGRIHMPRTIWFITGFMGLVGPALGLGIYTYERMKERLLASMEQLKDKEIADKELELARAFQARMMPAPEIAADGYRISSRNVPARYVAGDFYDVFRFADGAIGIAVADVVGKGVAASLIMATVKAVIPILASSQSIDKALMTLNEKLKADLGKREFVALAMARYEPATGTVIIGNAGLPDPYLVRKSGAIETINVPGPRIPLGLKTAIAYETVRVTLERGDAMFIFSDGLPEAIAPDGEQLGYERLSAIISATPDIDDVLVNAGVADDDQTLVRLERLI